MKTVTYEEFMSFGPCWDAEDVRAIYDQYPNGMTAMDILSREDVSAGDKLWAVLREEFIAALILHEFACMNAVYALSLIEKPDPRSVAAIETKRRWLRGEATDEELAAARDAARYVAWEARAATWCAARAATWCAANAAWYAAWYAAWCAANAARDAQVAVLAMMLEAEV